MESFLRSFTAAVSSLEAEAASKQKKLGSAHSKIDKMTAERFKTFVSGVKEIDSHLRASFRSLCQHGDCCLDFASQSTLLFSEGVQICARSRAPSKPTPRHFQSQTPSHKPTLISTPTPKTPHI